jgi:tetratricopeptide (TPR) repeat protein/CHAT domain-containing protein
LALGLVVALSAPLGANRAAISSDESALVRSGRALECAGRFESAVETESRALALARVRGDRAGAADALAARAVAEDDLGSATDALQDDRAAVPLYRALANPAAAAAALGNSGIALAHTGRPDDARRAYQAALAADRAIGDRGGEADELARIGLIDEAQGRSDQALATLSTALAIQIATHSALGEAKTRNNIGIIDERLARYTAALAMYRAALPLFRGACYARGPAADLDNTGVADADIGRYTDALALHERARALYRAIGDRRGEARTLQNIGRVDEALGRYDDGLRVLRDALAIDRAIHDPGDTSNALGTLGAIEEDLGNHELAIHNFQSALAIYRRVRDPIGQASALGDIGIAAFELREYDNAISVQQQAYAIDRSEQNARGEAEDLTNIGAIEEQDQAYEQARAAYESARKIDVTIGDRLGEAREIGNLAVVEDSLHRPTEALALARRAISLDSELRIPEALWRAWRAAAHAEAELDRPEQALQAYDAALAQIEDVRAGLERTERRAFFANKLFVYDEFIEYLLDLHGRFPDRAYDLRALEIFERRHTRAFLELVAQSQVRHFSGVPAPISETQRALGLQDDRLRAAIAQARAAAHPVESEIVALESELTQLARKRARLDATIRSRYPAFAALLHPQPLVAHSSDPAQVTFDALQKKVLRQGEAMAVYDVLADRTALWIITPDTIQLAILPQGAGSLTTELVPLQNYVNTIQESLLPTRSLNYVARHAQASYGPVLDAQARLYNELFPEPIRPLLAGVTTLFVVPTGPLYGFPFETLSTDATSGERPRYLIDDFAVSYLSSASLLAVLRAGTARAAVAPPSLLAFADPDYEAADPNPPPGTVVPAAAQQREAALAPLASGFPELRGTAEEAQRIFSAIGLTPTKDTLRTRADASVETLRRLNASGELERYRYVFFGAHAVMPDEVDGISNASLVLAHPPDGLFPMGEVFGLSLHAQAVILAACDTGRGVTTAGEGVQGLTQAFMFAGSPIVSVADWELIDAIQPHFSADFFSAMAAGSSPAAALRKAKLAMIDNPDPKSSQPYFWAPTVLFGDGDVPQ